ncbi:unnamed protein product [Somion occarium]|uniref:Uncharacterized protein n=1 Tax=Somion occarium TaxID=3059160 RepID=A0ABP1DUS8_9APHY
MGRPDSLMHAFSPAESNAYIAEMTSLAFFDFFLPSTSIVAPLWSRLFQFKHFELASSGDMQDIPWSFMNIPQVFSAVRVGTLNAGAADRVSFLISRPPSTAFKLIIFLRKRVAGHSFGAILSSDWLEARLVPELEGVRLRPVDSCISRPPCPSLHLLFPPFTIVL